jgi:hypothetical protein
VDGYADATRSCLKIVSDQQMAAYRQDSQALAEVDRQHAELETSSSEARAALKAHEAAADASAVEA